MWLTEPYEPKASVLISVEYHCLSYYNNRTIHANNSEELNKKLISSSNIEENLQMNKAEAV